MNIGKQIHVLLRKNIAVYVKGLGVFKRIHTPATFDARKNVYLPPVNFIEFDAEATDGYDLITYIQQTEKCERIEAEHKVEQEVSYIQEQVVTKGQVMLDNLGQLVGYGHSYVFKPLDLSGFSFTAVEPPFGRETAGTEEVEDTEQQPVAVEEFPAEADKGEEQVENTVVDTPVDEDTIIESDVETVFDEEEDKPVSANRAFIYGTLAGLAVLVIGGLYYYSQYYQGTPKLNITIAQPVQDTMLTMDTTGIILTQRDTLVEPMDSLPNEIVQVPVDTPAVQDKYTIVIGTHPTLAKAYEEAEAFNKDGHKSVRVITPNLAKNLKRVIWDTYATKEERDSALRYVRKHIKADAWGDKSR